MQSRPSSYWHRLFQDVGILRQVLSGHLAMLLADLPFALLYLLVIAVIASPVLWVLLLAIPALVAVTWLGAGRMSYASAEETRRVMHHERYLAELLAGQMTVKALMSDVALQPQWAASYAAMLQQSQHNGETTDRAVLWGQSLATLTTTLLLTIGALAVVDQQMSMGALIAATMLTSRILMPLNQLASQWKLLVRARLAWRNLEHFSTLPQWQIAPSLQRPMPEASVTLEAVTYTHGGAARPAVQQCSVQMQAGEIIGIVGRNGCGKSTLLRLMQGLYTPQEGRVLLAGMDITQLSRSELSRWVGYVPQECYLFEGSIRHNIAAASPEASDAEILLAAERAGVSGFIDSLPDGYATQIGENGQRLSGGQRQRIALARALLQHPPVLLLDEITSHLDTEAEMHLRNQLPQLATDRLVVLATHSLVMLRACTRIVVMENGRIVADDTSQKLLPRLIGREN
jgi:ATP-binding cassette subfamily C protein LapB